MRAASFGILIGAAAAGAVLHLLRSRGATRRRVPGGAGAPGAVTALGDTPGTALRASSGDDTGPGGSVLHRS
jgi:hypothetical protein